MFSFNKAKSLKFISDVLKVERKRCSETVVQTHKPFICNFFDITNCPETHSHSFIVYSISKK